MEKQMTPINSMEELLHVIQEGESDFFVGRGSIRSSKSIGFTKPDLSQISVCHEIDDTEEFINIRNWESSCLYSYISDGLLYSYK